MSIEEKRTEKGKLTAPDINSSADDDFDSLKSDAKGNHEKTMELYFMYVGGTTGEERKRRISRFRCG